MITHTQKRVLAILCRHWRVWGCNSWKGFEQLSKAINRPLQQTKDAVHGLRDLGLLEYSFAINTAEPQWMYGSGYFLTPKAERMA